jgi:uncharacterized protein YyaL (SSP411 family)
MGGRTDTPTAYVCRDFTCLAPAATPEQFETRLASPA